MSDTSQGPGWWLASDGKWYPPELWTGPPGSGPFPAAGPGSPQSGAPAYPAQGPTYGGAAWSGQPVPYGQPTQYGTAARRKTNGLAIASLVCSCAGIFLIGLPAVLGIIFGFVARSQIRRSQGAQGGDGLAMAGIIVGFAVVALLVVVFAVAAHRNNNSGVVQALSAVHVAG
jgi:hypothetical protein